MLRSRLFIEVHQAKLLLQLVYMEMKRFIYLLYITLHTMTTTISVRLDKSVLQELEKVEKKWQTGRSEVIRRLLVEAIKDWKIKNFLEKIADHKISVGKAAEECGISLWEMLEIVKENDVDWTGYSKEDLEKDLKILE